MKKLWITVTLCIVVIIISVPIVRSQIEKSRRRHQIGQLWMLITLYYIPAHNGQYPDDLAELRQLPKFSSFFDRAVKEVNLLTSGVKEDAILPNTAVLREKTADEHGYYWFHYMDGSIQYRQTP